MLKSNEQCKKNSEKADSHGAADLVRVQKSDIDRKEYFPLLTFFLVSGLSVSNASRSMSGFVSNSSCLKGTRWSFGENLG